MIQFYILQKYYIWLLIIQGNGEFSPSIHTPI